MTTRGTSLALSGALLAATQTPITVDDLRRRAGEYVVKYETEFANVVGLDVSLAIERELYLEFRERGYAPAPLLEHLVTAGYLGRKTGRGFRTYG